MYFEYQLTFDDFSEAVKARLPRKKKVRAGRLILNLAGYFAFGVCVEGLYLGLRQMIAIGSAATPSLGRGGQPPENLWFTLTPALVLIGVLVCASLIGYFDNRRRARIALANCSSPVDLPPAGALGATALLFPFVILVLPNTPQWAVYWRPSPDSILLVTALLWFSLLFILLVVTSFTRRSANLKAFAAARSLRRPWKVEAIDAGLSLDDGLNQSRYDWRKFDRYQETKNLLKLVTEDELIVIIPKCATADAETLEALCSLLQTKIAKGTFLPRDPRFQVLPLPVIPMDAAKEQ